MGVNFSIKDVPDNIAERLRARAARNHRSLQRELMAIVEHAAAEEPDATPAGQTLTRFGPGLQRGHRTVEDIHAEHLRLFPKAITSGPLAVDIVRADRDTR